MSYEDQKKEARKVAARWITVIVGSTLIFVAVMMAVLPIYSVWSKEKRGKADLAEAEWNRRIKVQEAEAAKDSATHLADAEIIRARGVAKANEIIGQSLKENEAYLRYLWIQGLQDGSSEVIYIPTEANLPILEAARKMPR